MRWRSQWYHKHIDRDDYGTRATPFFALVLVEISIERCCQDGTLQRRTAQMIAIATVVLVLLRERDRKS